MNDEDMSISSPSRSYKLHRLLNQVLSSPSGSAEVVSVAFQDLAVLRILNLQMSDLQLDEVLLLFQICLLMEMVWGAVMDLVSRYHGVELEA